MPPKQFNKIKKIFDFAIKNPYASFYKKKYSKIKFSKFNLETFKSLPFLTRDEIEKTPPLKRVFLPSNKISMVKVSSGTAHNPLMVLMDPLDREAYQIQKNILLQNKVKKLFYLLSAYQIYLRWDVYRREVKDFLLRCVGDAGNLAVSSRIAASVKVDGIETTPSLLYLFIPYLKEVYDLKKIKYISLSAEYTSRLRFDYFKKNFPNAYFNFASGSAEGRSLGYRCQYLSYKKDPRFFHFYPGIYGEAIDGELILTSLQKSAFPVIRYKSGNQAIIRDENCPCGQKVTLELLGRMQTDFVKIAGTIIHPQLIEKALMVVQDLIEPLYQLHIYEVEYRDRILPLLELKLIPKKGKVDQGKLKQVISESLYLSPTSSLKQLVEKGLFLPLKITLVEGIEIKGKERLIISHLN